MVTEIEHYDRLAAEHRDLPGLTDDAHVEQRRRQQRRMFDEIDRLGWRNTAWTEGCTGVFVELARKADIVIDVGAELGFYTRLAEIHAPGVVIAVEPDPVHAQLLREAFGDACSVEVRQVAVTDEPGTLRMTKPRGISATAADVEGDTFEVHGVRLAEVLPNGALPDLVKIDVEGAEARVLLGMQPVLAAGHTHIVLEFHPWVDSITPDGRAIMTDLFKSHGYALYRTDHGEPSPVDVVGGRIYAKPPAY